MIREYLETQITSRRQRLAALDKERAALVGELAAYEDALAKSGNESVDQTGADGTALIHSLAVSHAWRTILERMADFKYFNAGDVELAARRLHDDGKLKKPLTKDGVRAQLSLYTKKGILRRRGGGHYLLTDKTRAALELNAKTSLGQSS